MPRDGSNIYHYPVGIEGEPNQTIQSAPYNSFLSDVEQEANLPRPILAGGTGASSAAAALTALSGEKAGQVVTNYDSFVFIAGSFYSAAGATAAPTANAFSGICYLSDANNIVVEARDATSGKPYVRRKVAGVWGAWAADFDQAAQDSRYVNVTGDTMTGNLAIDPAAANAALVLDKPTALHTARIEGKNAGVDRWHMQLGTGVAEGGGNAGSNFLLSAYNDAGAFLSNALSIQRANGNATFGGTITATDKGNHFGSASGTLATGSVTLADTNLVLYNNGATNWAGIGSDTSGNIWFKVGVAGTPPPQMYLSSSTGFLITALGVVVPTVTAGENSTIVPNTAWVRTHVPSVAVRYDASQSLSVAQKRQVADNLFQNTTTQVFTSGSGTYTTPAGVTYIEIELIGGGGGGAGSGTTPGNGGAGGATTWGTGPLLSSGVGGGAGGPAGGAGGVPSGGYLNKPGVMGGNGSAANNTPGGPGAHSPYGGAGAPGAAGGGIGLAAAGNTGSGGGGAGQSTTASGGGGGGASGFIRAIINTPLASYSYVVGAAGAAGTPGTGGVAGGAGGSGLIVITEHYGG